MTTNEDPGMIEHSLSCHLQHGLGGRCNCGASDRASEALRNRGTEAPAAGPVVDEAATVDPMRHPRGHHMYWCRRVLSPGDRCDCGAFL